MRKTEKVQRIHNQEELDSILNKRESNTLCCFVQLSFGLRSSKDISLDEDGNYFVYNEIDDTEETIDHDELMNTFIGQALDKGALYKY